MKLVTWNTREVNKLHKQKKINFFMNENKVGIVAILKHKIKEQKAEKVIQKIAQGWKQKANYEHADKGRVWLLWNLQVIECVILSKSDEYIE